MGHHVNTGRRRLLTAGLGVLASVACPVWARSDAMDTPDAPQPTPLEIYDLDWTDARRQRAVPVRLYWPTAAESAALVVFSHGIGGSRRGYSYLGRFFAQQGIAALHVQHVGSDVSLWGGSPFSLPMRLQQAAQENEAIARAEDLRFALDQLATTPWFERIDGRRIVAAGHSYGANTTLLALGARVERVGRLVDLSEPRFAAGIVLSAPPFYGENDMTAILRHVTRPTLHVTATEDEIRVPGYYSAPPDRIAVYEATGSTHKTLAVFEGGSHSIFTDRTATGGPQLNARVKIATQELSLAFLTQLATPNDDPYAAWLQRHRPIVARFDRARAVEPA